MESEKYENEYDNLVNANELANKQSILRQRRMIVDIRQLQRRIEELEKEKLELLRTIQNPIREE